jgi:hypothetical protein
MAHGVPFASILALAGVLFVPGDHTVAGHPAIPGVPAVACVPAVLAFLLLLFLSFMQLLAFLLLNCTTNQTYNTISLLILSSTIGLSNIGLAIRKTIGLKDTGY